MPYIDKLQQLNKVMYKTNSANTLQSSTDKTWY